MRRHRITEEEKVAQQLSKIVSDVRLDLDLVGTYLANQAPNVTNTRLQIITEAAQYEKDKQNERTVFNDF